MTTHEQRPAGFGTRAVHAGQDLDEVYGAVVPPVHLSSTYAPVRVGELRRGYDYGRGTNPTRDALQTQLAALEALLPDFGDVRRIGSAALDLCMVADGTLDAYAEFGTQEYDWAAGALIAEEAGVPYLYAFGKDELGLD